MSEPIGKYEYGVLILGLAVIGFPIKQLLELETTISVTFAAVLMFLATIVTIIAVVHYWRFMSKRVYRTR